MRVLYLFAGSRKKTFEAVSKGLEPDTPLVGFYYLRALGIEARYLENWLTEFLRKISFNLTQLPVLWQARSFDWVFSGSGIFTLFLIKGFLKWKRPKWAIYNTYLSNLIKRNPSGLKGWVVRKAIASADAVICPSRAQANFLIQKGFDPKKIFSALYGIDTDFYQQNIHPETHPISTRYIFSAGRDIGRDYSVLMEAVRGLDVKVVIGAMPRNFPGIENFPGNVTVRYFPQKQMPDLYYHSEFVVIPTIPEHKLAGSDCSGQYVLLEAMACGKAVITTERSTLPDYFEAGLDGLTVPPEDPQALKDAIKRLWSDPAQAKQMGEHARKKALSLFTTKRFAADLAKIISS